MRPDRKRAEAKEEVRGRIKLSRLVEKFQKDPVAEVEDVGEVAEVEDVEEGEDMEEAEAVEAVETVRVAEDTGEAQEDLLGRHTETRQYPDTRQ